MAELAHAESVESATRAGEIPHVVAEVTTKRDTIAAIAAALEFPDWFGGNLDALYDCLIDLSWLPPGEHLLAWVAPQLLRAADPRAYQGIHQVLLDAQEWHAGRESAARLRIVTVG